MDIYVIVLASLLNRMFAFMLHSEYTTSWLIAESVVWHNIQNHLNINIGSFCLFVCQTARMFYSLAFKILWPEIFFPHSWYIEGKSSCAKRIEIIFHGCYRPRKLKSAKINHHVFLDKTAKIWRHENIPLYGIWARTWITESLIIQEKFKTLGVLSQQASERVIFNIQLTTRSRDWNSVYNLIPKTWLQDLTINPWTACSACYQLSHVTRKPVFG